MNLTLKKQLSLMAGIAIVAIFILGMVGHLLAKKTTIGGEQYRHIETASALKTDVAPPTLFLSQAMVRLQFLPITPQAEREKLIKEVGEKFSLYAEDYQKWQKNEMITDEMKDFIVNKLNPTAQAFMEFSNEKVIPLAQKGDIAGLNAALYELIASYQKHATVARELIALTEVYVSKESDAAESLVNAYTVTLYIVVILAIFFVVTCSWFFSARILSGLGADPGDLQRVAMAVSGGNANVQLPAINNKDSVMAAMAIMVTSIKEGLVVAKENSRIKQALDATSSNVMLADAGRNIIYMNKAVVSMLREAEADLRKALPHFSVDKIIGSNMDIFHRNPAHQSNLLANLSTLR